jgi:hypothetical protein
MVNDCKALRPKCWVRIAETRLRLLLPKIEAKIGVPTERLTSIAIAIAANGTLESSWLENESSEPALRNTQMEWLEPWWSTADADDSFHEAWEQQLRLEICEDNPIFGIPARIIGRGEGDDAVFELLDGSGRVAFVHLKWGKDRELGQFRTRGKVYESVEAFAEAVMRPDHDNWLSFQ